MILQVDGKYPLQIDPPSHPVAEDSYFSCINTTNASKSLNHLQLNARCWRECFSRIPQITSAIEWFGGLGICSTMLQEFLSPRLHIIYEKDADCYQHLKHRFPRADVSLVDAFKTKRLDADLVVLDWWKGTFLNFPAPDVFRDPYPNWIVFTDTAVNRFHLNLGPYARHFGSKVLTLRDYFLAGEKTILAERYFIHAVAYHFGSAKVLCGRVPASIEMIDVREQMGSNHLL